MRVIKPLYDARLGDLEHGDMLKVECRCGRVELVPGHGLAERGRLPRKEIGSIPWSYPCAG